MSEEKKILAGPYLLAPAEDEMTVAWEMPVECDAELTTESLGDTPKKSRQSACVQADSRREPPSRDSKTGFFIYTAHLEGLKPDTEYKYQIVVGNKPVFAAKFHTLAENPEHVRMVTVSDSHLFHTEKAFTKMIGHVKPDMILHGGDISFGTGYQREQYLQNWFTKIPEVLQETPVWYIQGNHDDGYFFESFFASPQKECIKNTLDGHTFSFDYGPAHITMIDSNPWGLFEMNAKNSGVEPDAQTLKRIHETLDWVKEDLASPSAKNAKWRIIMLHHPYTDDFNNRYIAPIAEKMHVDLVCGGHLHYYIQAVSINPEVGARTVYACEGSTQDPEAEYTPADGGKRLLAEFPEVTATGRSNYGVLDVTNNEISYKLYGFDPEGGEDKLVDTIVMTHDEPHVDFTGAMLRRMDNDGHVEIRAVAKNYGTGVAEAVMTVNDNGRDYKLNLFGRGSDSQVVLLHPNESREVEAIYTAKGSGRHKVSAAGVSTEIDVFEPPEITYNYMDVNRGTGAQADCIIASIEATNNFGRDLLAEVPFCIDQKVVEAKSIYFRGHEKRRIDFCYKVTHGGSYQVSIADSLPKEITIEGGIRVIPRVMDKSGCGHTALLHGSPKVITDKDGNVDVVLEDYGDYIEIPADKSLLAPDGFCGMVWARIDRLAKPEEMSHNPLMVRGKSVGWGATYMMRMVVERVGGLKWGTCHDITEYSWQGGNAQIGKWAQYTMTFDKKKGGDSYLNGENVAHVGAISPKDVLRQWETEPIFVGYSYIGHVIPELGRPKYFTHLPGAIRQVRFYKTHLTGEENKKVYEQPEEKGPEAKDLAVWLDFHDILTVGTHTTEWRHPAIYKTEYKTQKKYWSFTHFCAKTHIPRTSSIKATIEVSDDASTAKGSMTVTLQNGTQHIDISTLPKAQYIRIYTEFAAEMGPDGTFVPVLDEYQVTATNGTDNAEIFWSTKPSWEKGRFTGAVGFAPVDRLREFPEYTDVIHG